MIYSLEEGRIKALSPQDLPSSVVAELISKLRKMNVVVPKDVITSDDLLNYLTRGEKRDA